MKKNLSRIVIFICIFAFCSYSFVPKKTEAFVPLVVGGVYVSYEVILATATLCAAMGIVIVNKDQLVAMAEKFNSIPDFANHVIGHSVVQIEEYWFQFLVDRVSVDGSTPIEYNYAPTDFVGTGLASPFTTYVSNYLKFYNANDLGSAYSVMLGASDNYWSFITSSNSWGKSLGDVITSVQGCGYPYMIIKATWDSGGTKMYGYKFLIDLDDNTLENSSSLTYPSFDYGRALCFQSLYLGSGDLYTRGSGSLSNINSSINSGVFNTSYTVSSYATFTNSNVNIGYPQSNYQSWLWDYGNCTLPKSYDSSKVGEYGQVTSPALPTDQAKHWGDVFGADQAGSIDMGKALDDLKAKGIDTSKAATVDGVNAIDISYPLDSVQDIPDVDVGDISQDSSVPYVPDFDIPNSDTSAKLDFTPLMIVTRKFPFSLPWDLAAAISCLAADPKPPAYTFPAIPVGLNGVTYVTIPSFEFNLADLPNVDTLVNILRTFEILSFCVFLIVKTRDIIRS